MNPSNKIPLVDLKAQYAEIKEDIDAAIKNIIDNTSFVKGPPVAEFEANFASEMGIESSSVVGCANGTAAVTLALRSVGVTAGDEVILPSHTFFATVESVVAVGAIPVFVDIRSSDYTMDPEQIADAITDKTKAILPVHIYGTPCDMSKIEALCEEHSLKLVEDCAQAHLAEWDNKKVSTFGDAAGFSFFPGKNLGAYGDAGAVIVKDSEQAAYIRRYVDHGRTGKYESDLIGDNLRIDALQASILNVKLGHLCDWTESRRAIAARYDDALKAAGFKVIQPDVHATPAYHLYVVEVSNRDQVQAELAEAGIASGIHYPIPCHAQAAMTNVEHRVASSLTVTERIVQNIISLPVYPELDEDQQARVIERFMQVAIPA